MSDTTTITAEERARLRSVLSEHGNPQVEDRIILRLLNTVEQAEARAEKAEKELAGADAEIAELRDELEDSRGTEKDAPNVLCAIARLVGVYEHSQELGDDMGTMVLEAVQDLIADKQKAEANVARLTKMVDWLASHTADICARVYQDSYDLHWWTDCEWKEAARKAVADESEVNNDRN